MPNYQPYARRVARKYGIPEGLFFALVNQESGWNPSAVSPAGAIGLTQLMPGTASGLGVNPRNWRQNLEGGARYLSTQYRRFGSWREALAAYNAGPGNVENGNWRNIAETTNYVRTVLGNAGNVRSGPTPTTPGSTPTMPSPPTMPQTQNFLMPALAQMAQQNLAQIAAGKPPNPLEQLGSLTQTVQGARQAELEAQQTGGTIQAPRSDETGRPPGEAGEHGPILQKILKAANRQRGQPYVWGGESRAEGGFDCSGLIQWAYAQAGIPIPRVTTDQKKAGRAVQWGDFQPGDLIFSNNDSHVVMYVGNGQVIAAPHTGAVVRYQPLSDFQASFSGARRIL